MISTINKKLVYALSVIFYLLIWQILSLIVGEEILLVSPIKVLIRFSELILEKEFYKSIIFSTSRIIFGFLLALFIALCLSLLSNKIQVVRVLLKPLISFIKATPVASIVIVVLIWVSSKNLSTTISFMMVFPILYASLLTGFDNVDTKLLELSRVYNLSFKAKLKAIYIPSILPHFVSSSNTAIGLCFKSGIAAEVIGLPDGSIGERLYEAKTFLASSDIFAITLTIIILSVGIEKLFTFLITRFARRSHLI